MIIRRRFFALLVIALSLVAASSCAVLTKSQLEMVTKLTVASDSVAASPKKLFSELTHVRFERGLFYAASLSTAAAREKEINALSTSLTADEQMLKKAEAYVNVLNSYLRALRSISADARWTTYGTEWRGIGRNIDSLLLRYNQIAFLDSDLTVGWAKLSGQYMGYLSERYIRHRQAKAVRAFISQGDTLVTTCVDGIIEVLKRNDLIELIENESEGLKRNYATYLRRLELLGMPPDFSGDRTYVELLRRVEAAKTTRSRCITALQSLKRAHAKLVTELKKRQKIDFFFDELIELNTLALQLQSILEK
jgi:hypothetical protein